MSNRNLLRDRFREVMDRVGQAASRIGRDPKDILVVAVTKNASPDQLRQLLEMGHQDLGENRVQHLAQRVAMTQEFVERHRAMISPRKIEVPKSVRWHMIGTLQRNKVKQVLPLVRLIHSIDSLRLAEEVQAQAERQEIETDVLVQVNTSGESSKQGVALSAAPHLVEQMLTMFNVRVRGLMTMAPEGDANKIARPVFQRTAEVFYEMQKSGRYGEHFNVLSMGMTDDFEQAIESGANLVRLGRAFFGEPEESEAA